MPAERQGSLSRRTFVGGAVGVPIAAWAAAGEPDRPEATAAAAPGWREVRRLFALDPRFAHLSAFILAPHSAPVRAAIERHRRGLDRDPRRYLGANEHREDDAAAATARHLRTDPRRVALTDSTTMGLGIVFGGLRLGRGDEILRTAHEHFA